jgi:hypothetical protein
MTLCVRERRQSDERAIDERERERDYRERARAIDR